MKQFKFRIEPNMNSCILMFHDIDVHLPSASTPGPIFKYMSQTLHQGLDKMTIQRLGFMII